MAEVRKKGKSGQRGIKQVDRVQDTELFISDYKEAKATGAIKHFTPEESIEGWLHRRYEFFQLLTELKKQTNYLEESKSPEVKILSRQINLLAQMLNLTNKNVI